VMRQKCEEKNEESPEEAGHENGCHHFWVIEIANGPSSRGECKFCGETRDFLNSITNINDPKRKSNPLKFPKLSRVKLQKESNS
jgi:hypothetical protein